MKYLRWSNYVRPWATSVRVVAPWALQILQLLYEGMAKDGSQRIVPLESTACRPNLWISLVLPAKIQVQML